MISNFKLVVVGNIMVNLPVTLSIIVTAVLIGSFFELSWNTSLIFGVIVGWWLWSKLLILW
jgi:hypothetical protein